MRDVNDEVQIWSKAVLQKKKRTRIWFSNKEPFFCTQLLMDKNILLRIQNIDIYKQKPKNMEFKKSFHKILVWNSQIRTKQNNHHFYVQVESIIRCNG